MTTLDATTWRRTTDGGIPYKLMEGYPKIQGSGDKVTATEKYIIRSSDVNAFYVESIPAPLVFLGSVTWPNRRRMPGAAILITKSVDFEPFNSTLPFDPFDGDDEDADDEAPDGTYDPFCAVSISYETVQNESGQDEQDPNDPETFLEHSVTIGGEFLSIPNNKIELHQGGTAGTAIVPGQGTPIKDRVAPIVKTIPLIEHQLKWKNCLRPFWSRIISYLGHINDRKYTFSGGGTSYELAARKHCMLFMGVSGQQSYLWNGASIGVQPWSLDFRFMHKEVTESGKVYGWRHIYVPEDGKWVQMTRANGEPLYQEANLVKLFTA